MIGVQDQRAPVDRRRVKIVVIISLAISAVMLLLFDALALQTLTTTTSLVIFQYEDGRVVAFSSKASVPRNVGLTDSGVVTLDFPVRRFGRPAVSTIRRQPPSIQISWFTGGRVFNAPVTSAQREAIAKALREQGADAESLAVERNSPIVERFWWKWGLNALAGWMFSMFVIYLILEIADYVRNIHSGLRASEGRCPSCNYDLTGCPKSEQCPECGISLPQQARFWAARKNQGGS